MPSHTEHRLSSHSADQLYNLVIDVESYPKFLPWCEAARILKREEGVFTADLVIGFKAFREKYTSRVSYNRESYEIKVEMIEGPFSHLHTYWQFEPREKGSVIHFDIEFHFRTRLLEMLVSSIFYKAMQKLTAAFEERAEQLYGENTKE